MIAALLSLTGSAHAACSGPAELVARLKAHPGVENTVLLGSWYASHKQFDCASITFRSGLKTDPKSAQLHYLLGLALLGQRQNAPAIKEVEESARLEPQVIKPHLLLASLHEGEGKTAEAEEQWRKALHIDPKSEEALEGLSNELLSRKDYAGVIAVLHSAPRTEKLAINLSRALGELNYLDDAAQILTDAIKLAPGSLDLPKAMTVVLVNMHKYEQAIKLVQTTAAAHPDNMDAQFDLFRIFVLTNHFDRALEMEPKILAWHPHDSEVLYLSGMVDRAVGKTQEAKSHLEESVTLNPNFFNSRYNLGIVLVLLHEWKPAKENLEKAVELDTPVPEVHFELAKALRGLGETDRAAEEMKTYQALRKSDEAKLEAAAAAAQGDKDLADGKLAEAATRYKEAIESAPSNAVYKYKFSIALRQNNDTAGERAQLEQAVKLDPNLAGAQNELGYLLARDGDGDGAVEHFRMAVQSAPAWTDAWINLAGELAVISRFPEAREAVAKALALEPDNAQARELSEQLSKASPPQRANSSKGPSS